MSNKFHTTAKGTVLPLLNLKGKDYLMVGYRMVWFREVHPLGMMETQIIQLNETTAIVKATISVPVGDGSRFLKLAEATKREDAKHFPDFLEKAETGALGRALAISGFGTQFSLPEFEEGDRLADSPLESVKKDTKLVQAVTNESKVANIVANPNAGQENADLNPAALKEEAPKKNGSFRKPKEKLVITPEQENEWS